MISEIPVYIYKYRTFDKDEYYKGLILKNELFFSSINNFNDPFDCKVVPNYEMGTKKEMFQIFFRITKEDYPHYSEKKQLQIAKKEYDKNVKILASPELYSQRINEIVNNFFGVCSLTEDKNNLLMWGHYANCHQGFCVEYDSNELFKVCLNYLKIHEAILIHKINYAKDYPIINPYKIKNHNELITWLITKSIDWSYEKEWRLIYVNNPNKKLVFPDQIMKAIYFGVNCAESNITIVKDLIKGKKNKPKLYRSKLKRFEFGLDFSEIN